MLDLLIELQHTSNIVVLDFIKDCEKIDHTEDVLYFLGAASVTEYSHQKLNCRNIRHNIQRFASYVENCFNIHQVSR